MSGASAIFPDNLKFHWNTHRVVVLSEKTPEKAYSVNEYLARWHPGVEAQLSLTALGCSETSLLIQSQECWWSSTVSLAGRLQRLRRD